jgi:hypothetical protein
MRFREVQKPKVSQKGDISETIAKRLIKITFLTSFSPTESIG